VLFKLVECPLHLYLFNVIFLVFFCNVILSRGIGPRLSLSLKTTVHSLFLSGTWISTNKTQNWL